MEKTKEIVALTEMRKLLAKQGSSAEYGDEMLMRFLIARSMDPVKSASMLIKWQKWREEFVPLGFISESEVPDQLATRKIYLQGLSKIGHHPVIIIVGSKHYSSNDHLQVKKYMVHILDKAIASSFNGGTEIGNEKIIVILDLDKISYKNLDTRAVVTAFQFLQSYYPERLATWFIIGMPSFFISIWKMISHFIDKASLEKVVIVKNEEDRKRFIEVIGEETLPEEYGGRAKLVALQDVTYLR